MVMWTSLEKKISYLEKVSIVSIKILLESGYNQIKAINIGSNTTKLWRSFCYLIW